MTGTPEPTTSETPTGHAHGGWIPDDHAPTPSPTRTSREENATNGAGAGRSGTQNDTDTNPDGDDGDDAGERTLMYRNVEEWVGDYLAPHYRRRLGGQTAWCQQWWKHEEAISVLTALWSAWEHLRHDGALGLINWWLQYCYPAMDRLTSPDTGPFASCGSTGHTQLKPLRSDPGPDELRTNPAFADLSQSA